MSLPESCLRLCIFRSDRRVGQTHPCSLLGPCLAVFGLCFRSFSNAFQIFQPDRQGFDAWPILLLNQMLQFDQGLTDLDFFTSVDRKIQDEQDIPSFSPMTDATPSFPSASSIASRANMISEINSVSSSCSCSEIGTPFCSSIYSTRERGFKRDR